MKRELLRRVSRAEKLLPGVLERGLKSGEHHKQLSSLARVHATAVAAIVLHGQPKISEPLMRAWARTLACCNWRYEFAHDTIKIQEFLSSKAKTAEGLGSHEDWPKEYQAWLTKQGADPLIESIEKAIPKSWEYYAAATEEMSDRIGRGTEKEEAGRFTEIFRTAPIWLLNFSLIRIDAALLNFDIPDVSEATEWGEIGLRDAWRWPMLPIGLMTEGDPVASGVIDLSEEECLFIAETTHKQPYEWSRHERLRMSELIERRSGRKVDPALQAKIESYKQTADLYSEINKVRERTCRMGLLQI